MDENVVFNPPPGANQTPPTQDENQRVTVQDLYAPSSPDQIQQPVQPIQQPPPVSEQVVQSTVDPNLQQTAEQQVGPPPGEYTEDPYNVPVNAGGGVGFLGGKLKIILGGIIGIIVLLLVIGLVSRLFSRPPAASYSKAQLVYWGLWEEERTLKPIINDFEKKYPGITVEYIKSDKVKYKDRVTTRIDNDDPSAPPPDIFTFHNSWTSTMLKYLLPLPQDVIDPKEFQEQYFPVIQQDLTNGGAIFGLPQGIDTLALFINKDIFRDISAPQTWDDFNSAAKTIVVKDPKDRKIKTAGAAIGTYDNVTHASDLISLLLAVNGVELQKITESKNLPYLTQALAYYTEYASGTDSVWDETMKPSREAFANGQVGMYFGFSWDIFAIKELNKNLKFDVYPVPYLPPAQGQKIQRISIASYWVNGVSKKSKHQKEAFLFMKYLSDKSVMQKMYTEQAKSRGFGTLYPRRDLAKSIQDNPQIYPFIQQAEYARSTLFSSDTWDTTYSDQLNNYLKQAITAIRSGSSADSASSTLVSGVDQVKSKFSE